MPLAKGGGAPSGDMSAAPPDDGPQHFGARSVTVAAPGPGEALHEDGPSSLNELTADSAGCRPSVLVALTMMMASSF